MPVYADILVSVNLIVNYFLLLGTGRLCQRSPQRLRLLLGALLGALYAMVLFVQGLPPWVLLASKLAVSALMVRVGFVYLSGKEFLRQYLVFFIVNFLFAGVMLAVWLLVAPRGMLFCNGIVYFDISAVMLVAFTALAYGAAELFARMYQKQEVENGMYQVTIELNQKQIVLTGFFDTGNTLKDVYTGYPVVICNLESIRSILPASLRDIFATPIENPARLEEFITIGGKNRFKFVPYSTLEHTSILPAFRPDHMRLQKKNYSFCVENVYLAVTTEKFAKGDYDLLLNPELLSLGLRTEKTQKKKMAKIS